MKKRLHRKLLTLITAISLIISCVTMNVSVSAAVKVDEKIIALIEAGEQSINVRLRYEDIDGVEITEAAKAASYEYAKTLDTSLYTQEEIEHLRFRYYADLNNQMNIDARNERTALILSTLGADPEDAECAYGYPQIICKLTPEQIEIAKNMELIVSMYLEDTTVLPNTLEQLVSHDGTFDNNEMIYSDRYKFAMERGVEDGRSDALIVYGIPQEDCVNDEWENHLVINTAQYTYAFDIGIERDFYSGLRYSVGCTDSKLKLEKPLSIYFYIEGEEPLYGAPSEIDVEKYIAIPLPDGEMYGDINSDSGVDIADVIAINMYLLSNKENTLSEGAKANADCVRDNVINEYDSAALLNYIAELTPYENLGK